MAAFEVYYLRSCHGGVRRSSRNICLHKWHGQSLHLQLLIYLNKKAKNGTLFNSISQNNPQLVRSKKYGIQAKPKVLNVLGCVFSSEKNVIDHPMWQTQYVFMNLNHKFFFATLTKITIVEKLSTLDVWGIPGYNSENRIKVKLVSIFIAAIKQCFTFKWNSWAKFLCLKHFILWDKSTCLWLCDRWKKDSSWKQNMSQKSFGYFW